MRGIDADFKRIEYRGEDAQAKTINKGLTIRLDLDQYPDLDRAQQLATSRIMRRLLRNELRRAVAALTAVTGAGTGLTWDTTAGKDPDQDVLTFADLGDGRERHPAEPGVVRGGGVEQARAGAPCAEHGGRVRLVDADAGRAGGVPGAGWREDQQGALPADLDHESEGGAGLGVRVLRRGRGGLEDPSNLKRFLTPVEGGGRFRVYVQQVSAKLVDVTVELYSNIVAVATVGTFRLNIS